MRFPVLGDTIVAVSTAWTPAPLGVIRLSGPDARRLAADAGAAAPPDGARLPLWLRGAIRIDGHRTLPALVYHFAAPRSYTGEDVVEIHTVGSLPLLRVVADALIVAGARRALPGEFTARAFLHHRLSAAQVDAVGALLHAQDAAALRQAARGTRASAAQQASAARDALADLLAHVEAGIDFVDEEDVRFITPADVRQRLHEITCQLSGAACTARDRARDMLPHVALVGPPNAGKSTLFNALLGRERALVSPVLGTTRDVLSAEIEIDGMRLVLQDCAGMGGSTADLELATYCATEQTAARADLVLWVHAADQPWTPAEDETFQRTHDAPVLVISKSDVGPALQLLRGAATHVLAVCGLRGDGLDTLRRVLLERLRAGGSPLDSGTAEDQAAAAAAVARAAALVAADSDVLSAPELIALELRSAWNALAGVDSAPPDEVILSRVFSRFCVGK